MMSTRIPRLTQKQSGLAPAHFRLLQKLTTPSKIQDFLNSLPFNFEENGATQMSVRRSLEQGKAHCFEGALIAAAALWIGGHKPILLDLRAVHKDVDHVVALFEKGGCWGAISKTNHGVLRYREPIYASVRELALSYFHEYFLPDGKKTLRSFSRPFDLSKRGSEWMIGEEELFDLVVLLDDSLHAEILTKAQIKQLRLADPIERRVGEIVEWKK
jgi:hypothetical protein